MKLAYPVDEISSFCADFDAIWEFEFFLDDLAKHCVLVFGVERWDANKHFVTDKKVSNLKR